MLSAVGVKFCQFNTYGCLWDWSGEWGRVWAEAGTAQRWIGFVSREASGFRVLGLGWKMGSFGNSCSGALSGPAWVGGAGEGELFAGAGLGLRAWHGWAFRV